METIVITQIILSFVFVLITVSTYFLLGAKILTANIFLLSLYAIVVPVIFFTFGKFIEGKITENEIERILDETIRIYKDFGGHIPPVNIPVDTDADDKAEKNNNQLQINILISKIYIRKKMFKDAEEILFKLVNEYSNIEIGYLNLSELYILTKELDKGISIIKKGISKFPNNVPLYKNLATIYKNNGLLNKAIEIHLLIIKKNEYDFNSYYELSTIYDFKDHKDNLNLLLNTNINELNISSKIYAGFALSNIFHKRKEYDKSAYFLKIANDESLKISKSTYQLRINNAEFIRSLDIKKQR